MINIIHEQIAFISLFQVDFYFISYYDYLKSSEVI